MCHLAQLSLFLMLPLLSPADGGAPRHHTEQVLPPPYLHLPVFVDSRVPLVERERFSPARGSGQEPLPAAVREILIPTERPSSPLFVRGPNPVRTRCKMNKMHVQVDRSLFGTDEPRPQLRLGSCEASNHTKDFLHFEYEFGTCGATRTIIDNQVAYSNTLRYDPPKIQGPIRRAVPFFLSVACYYNRYQYSYKIGYKPKMQMHKIFKSMKNRAKFTLTPRNVKWERLFPSDQFVLGKPMYFEAEAVSISPDKRLYVHSCHVTPDNSHTSKLQFPVVKNFGCMTESKDSHSRFIPYKNNVVRFTVDAFLFKGMTDQHLYMHCNISVGTSVPSPTTKSCNYDPKAGRWVELYGPPSVCSCCDSNCSSVASTAKTKTITSKLWTIKPEVRASTIPKRTMVSTTSTSSTTTSAATTTTAVPQPGTEGGVTAGGTQLQAGVTAESTVKDMDWPFRGGGVTWVGLEGDQKRVKGSAVVDQETVTEPHRIFEETFDFDK
ncbi:hypothetical protein JOB18_035381 [Solea senegalensis]|uniref:Zona pellucida sperm-binding protein 3 n=1 Tax=Solea senegalensis TaxID=28829 RepID=A0AAV6PTC3_SOLSE|nr:zona pellucida sperm-binding protein 3-like [Solea senegalensis]KAG7475665.1 hypothetical protein JOB18_035381 [Solea senegalensis]